MQKKNLRTGNIDNISIATGIKKEELDKLVEEIDIAIKNNTLATNEKLRVSAIRLSLYGDDGVHFEKDKKGYYRYTSFIDADKHEMYNIDKIKKGAKKISDIEKNTDYIDPFTGKKVNANFKNAIKADKFYIAKALNEAKELTEYNQAMILGQNHTVFDTPIVNSILNR